MDKYKRKTLYTLGMALPAYSISKTFAVSGGLGLNGQSNGSGQISVNFETLTKDFVDPPMSSRPGAFWCWLNGDVTKASITSDLEEMKDKGMARAEIWDVEARDDIYGIGPEFLGDQSVEYIRHALSEGKRLGIRIGMVASSGWNAGGAWVEPDWAGKALYSSELELSGPQSFSDEIPFPELTEHCPRDNQGKPIFHKEVTVIAIPTNGEKKINDFKEMVFLNDHFDGTKLVWDVPEGDWTILRFVCLNTGQHLVVPSPNSDGLFIDFFDPEATKKHLGHIFDRIGITKENYKEIGLGYLEFDSMELDVATAWTDNMASIFQDHNGYDVLPFLPVFAGWELPEGNDDFIYDFNQTVSDQLIFSHYTTGRDFLAEYDADLVAEAGGPGPPIWNSCPVDALKALGNVSIPRGEFWVQNKNSIFLVKEVASASHIYGLGTVDAESFTTWRRWKDAPHALKSYVDRAFCEGLNMVTFHTFANSRPEHGLPGRAYHAGSDINPTTTWWRQSKSFMSYLSRCSYLLSLGLFAADVAYYYGDKAPNFFPEYQDDPNRPRLNGLSAGYDFDVVNTDVIMNRMTVSDGKVTLPDGLDYKLLVLPHRDDIPEHVVKKVEELIAAGAKVLVQHPEIAKTIKGNVIKNISIDDALEQLAIAKDFDADEDKVDFIHRKIGDADLYFISNLTNRLITEDCAFRIDRKHPEYWDPVTDKQYNIQEAQVANGYTNIKLKLDPYQSCFIMFNNQRRELPEYRTAIKAMSSEVTGAWTLSFPENWGAPASVELDKLISWTEHENQGINYFSGTASYKNNFNASKSDKAISIDLGDVRDVAEVIVNGKSAGVLWTKPFKLNIRDHVKEGNNTLEIKITNMWVNRLTGDMNLPAEERFTKTNIPDISDDYANQGPNKYYSEFGDEAYRVQTAGLLGPVKIEIET
ncbi:MAG: hypothetical protein HOH19_08490 [Kordiimonadaceae bacterium]|jgi:hypothetical protein|nr:hypothetical protein [Kordiimonadaceae bacterium]MBT6032599.1 hypothetical protein [Kordiimonadaceae bacterium]